MSTAVREKLHKISVNGVSSFYVKGNYSLLPWLLLLHCHR